MSPIFARPWRLEPELAAYSLRALARSRGFRPLLDHIAPRTALGLEEIGAPTLIAWGTRDRLLLPRQARRFARRIPGAELRWLNGLGHVPMPDDPDAVAGAILDFTGSRRAAVVAR
jgi:pimeloyl-ACP methyl ester carboxylesterase